MTLQEGNTRLTVEIPLELHRQAKIRAAELRTDLRTLVIEGLRIRLSQKTRAKEGGQVMKRKRTIRNYVLPFVLGGMLIAGSAAAGQDKLETAGEFLDQCTNTTQGSYRDGYCLGYVVAAAEISTGTLTHCIPDGATQGQSLLVVMKWIRDHPELHHLYRRAAIIRALHEAFPCAVKP